MSKPSEEIRKIWEEMKEIKCFQASLSSGVSIERYDELRDKYENIEILFGHESTLLKAIIYYEDTKNGEG